MDTVKNFPNRLKTRPQRFKLALGQTPESAFATLQALLKTESERRTFTYKKSDGTSFTLSMADVMNREKAFEMAYNPNDCIEVRWGAPEGSAERASCVRRAPDEHTERMRSYQVWFQKRVRPLN